MYGSDLEHKGKAKLTSADLMALRATLACIEPAKLTISGGGEPFLELQTCLSIIEHSTCPRIELVTAAHWADNAGRAVSTLEENRKGGTAPARKAPAKADGEGKCRFISLERA